jgi:hypothetical protein
MSSAAAQRTTPVVADWRRRYQIVRPLGSGGSATVYEAIDHELGRRVALKVTDERRGLSARVAREVETVAALTHHGIVRLYDVFADGEHSFIVYELVEGDTLDTAVGVLPDDDVVEVGAQILEAVSHAHAQGVVHRDIKPQNVMLTRQGRVKVMDFGIARLTGTDTLTAEGDMLGTIAYMSPEQAGGRRVGPASDVYSAAVVMYELLSGEHPTPGRTPGERLGNTAAGNTVPLELRRPDLPSELLQAVAAALSPVPARRPSAADLADRLRSVLATGELRRHRVLSAADLSRAQALGERVVGAGLAGASLWSLTGDLPAYPPSWRLPLMAVATAVWAVVPSGGLAFLLGALAFPLFNVSLSVGALYLPAAVVTLFLARSRPVSVLWPALALLLTPLYATFLAPAAAGVLGRVRGPLTAAWAAVGTSFYLTLTGADGSPFTFFQAPGDAAGSIAGADGFFSTAAAVVSVLLSPAALLQAVVWAALAVALPHVVGAARLERRLWAWSLTFGGLFAACALLPAALLGAAVTTHGLLLNLAVVAVVTLGVALPGLGSLDVGGAGGHETGGAGDDDGVQEDREEA